MADISITVTGIKEVVNFTNQLSKNLETKIRAGMKTYINDHLLVRIRTRLTDASAAQTSAVGRDGLVEAAGGYGTPQNDPKWKERKANNPNLPMVGAVSTRELVATGHLLDKIKLTKLVESLDLFEAEVGPENVERPHWGKGTINNLQLNEWIEDSDYKFWAKEYSDCEREMVPYLTHLIIDIIKELALKYKYTVE